VIDDNDDPLVAVVNGNADLRRGAKGLSAWAQVLFLVLIAGFGASLWPEAVPGFVSIWQNASVHRANVLGNSILVIVPLLLLYGLLAISRKQIPCTS
jgi:cytochrome bd-type quinol oxidase subunit 2